MILKAKHNILMYGFFKFYTAWKIKRNFQDVFIKGEFNDRNMPVLLVSNHISWWDGFWAEYLNLKIFRRKFYFMMLEEQLKRFSFFNKTGGFSIKKKSKSIIETLNYTAGIIKDNNNLVLLFPQGEIQSIYTIACRFEKGLEYILKIITWDIHVIFLVNLIDYFSYPKPGLYMYFKEYQNSDFTTLNIEKEYNIFYAQCIAENVEKKGAV